uniref:Uncharacterized protein n=1 Tax=Equus asinus asinus TaxID=83772 RepID=A0A8C4MHU6_EQUAS
MGEKPGTRPATFEGSDALPPSYPIFPVTPLHPQLTVYLGKRDFVDHLDKVDPVGKCPESGITSPKRGRSSWAQEWRRGQDRK